MEQLGISPEIINLTQLISIVVQDLSSISRRKIDMKMPDEEVYIQADSARINQVLTNLVSNAIQHSGQDDKIIVALEPSDDFVEIKVTDQGEGISPENLQQVFNKFFSGKGAAGGQQIGLGLGLFLSKHIVDLHHGNITASSRLGKGSTFVIQLPFEQN
jgi:signal transduction histidine kinase